MNWSAVPTEHNQVLVNTSGIDRPFSFNDIRNALYPLVGPTFVMGWGVQYPYYGMRQGFSVTFLAPENKHALLEGLHQKADNCFVLPHFNAATGAVEHWWLHCMDTVLAVEAEARAAEAEARAAEAEARAAEARAAERDQAEEAMEEPPAAAEPTSAAPPADPPRHELPQPQDPSAAAPQADLLAQLLQEVSEMRRCMTATASSQEASIQTLRTDLQLLRSQVDDQALADVASGLDLEAETGQ